MARARLAALVLMQLVMAHAVADEPAGTQAREHFAVAHKLFAEGRFADAADEFKRAYALDPVPKYLYDAAQSARLAGECAQAIGMYQAFEKVAPDKDARLAAADNIARCRASEPPSSAPASSPSPAPSA